ncbi:MAG TPA: DUF3667 domain-containing protein [Longimicrobiaceae bacterium]|nr:DUF3667 domain-containing protein [Longimicrobiaceae bacterium]
MKAPIADPPAEAAAERPPPRCGNCRAVLAGPFCARCGQRDVDLNVSTRSLLSEGARELVEVDRRFLLTLRLLFFRPGHLTRTYLKGRRAMHTSPLRLYLVASALFFSAYVLTQGVREGYSEARNPARAETARQLEPAGPAAAGRPAEALPPSGRLREFGARLAAGQRRAILDRGAFVDLYSKRLSWARLLTLPVLSLVLGLVHVRAGRRLVQHLVFSLHFGAVFLFGFLALMMAGVLAKAAMAPLGISPLEAPDVNRVLYVPGGIALLAYLYLAMRRVYGERTRVGAARFALTAVLFAGSLFLAFLAAAVHSMLMLA